MRTRRPNDPLHRYLPARRSAATIAAACCAIGLSAASADAGSMLPVVVFSTFDSASNTINVPGVGNLQYGSWNGLTRSPNGERWIFVAGVTGDASVTRAVVAGSGTSAASAQVVAKRSDAIPGVPTRTINLPDRPRITDAGTFAFTTNTLGSGSPSLFALRGSLSPTPSWAPVAAIGTPIDTIPGATYSSIFSSLFLDNAGRVGLQCGLTDGAGASQAVLFNGQIVARSNDPATAPTLLPGTGTDNWSMFSLNRVWTSADGSDILWWGTTAGGLNVVTINNVAVAQSGSPLPADPTGPNVAIFNSASIESNGDWFVRGTLSDNDADPLLRTDFVVRNGQLIAKRGEPIVPGSPIVWDRVAANSTLNGFLFNVGNNQGDYVVAGNCIIDPDTGARGAAVVLNGQTILFFRGDAIDVNGNGAADDDAFILGIKNEVGIPPAFLTDAGDLWMVVDVRNGAGTELGDAVIRTRLDLGGAPCPGNYNGDASVDLLDLLAFNADWSANLGQSVAPGSAGDYNANGTVDLLDLLAFNADWSANLGQPCP